MIIKIDAREKKVIPLCKEFIEKHSIKDITVEVVGLPLGDMIITDNDGCEKIMIERKSLPEIVSPSMRMIKSPLCRPAFAAGVSSIGATTLTKPSSKTTSIPKPPNLPVVPSFKSSYRSFFKYEE